MISFESFFHELGLQYAVQTWGLGRNQDSRQATTESRQLLSERPILQLKGLYMDDVAFSYLHQGAAVERQLSFD